MQIKVLVSGAFSATLKDLTPDLEQATGHTLMATLAPSMGNSPDTIPHRIERDEDADVILMVLPEIQKLEKAGKILAGSVIEVAQASMALAVRSGSPKPPLSTEEDLKRIFLQAGLIAVSESASGVYLREELLKHLDIASEIGKVKSISGELPGKAVARGEADVVLEQLAELLPVEGIDVVGLIPASVQRVTVVAAAIPAKSQHGEAARALIESIAASRHYPLLRKNGLQPPAGCEVAESAQ